MYTKHHNYPCDGLHFVTFMFLLVHGLYDCQCEFLCTSKVEVVVRTCRCTTERCPVNKNFKSSNWKQWKFTLPNWKTSLLSVSKLLSLPMSTFWPGEEEEIILGERQQFIQVHNVTCKYFLQHLKIIFYKNKIPPALRFVFTFSCSHL